MRSGFGLVEVMVALCILMLCAAFLFRMNVAAVQARSQGDRVTRASVLAATQFERFISLAGDAPALAPGWHQDPGNPIVDDRAEFFRFWNIEETTMGKSVMVYVAWTRVPSRKATDFASLEDAQRSLCPMIGLGGLVDCPDAWQAPVR